MQMKIYAILLLATLLLACKPAAQATVQSNATSTTPSSGVLDERAKEASVENVINEEDKLWRRGMPGGITESFYACIKKSNSNDFEEANCASDEKRLQDERLNKIYKELLASSNDEQKKSLVEAQRSWLAWTDKEELFEQVVYGGAPMDNVELELREMERLARRTDELEHFQAQTSTDSVTRAEDQASTNDANASCPEARVLFYCATKKNKEIKLCDRGETLEYSFGETGERSELMFSLPREKASTSQWQGIGRWISYSITLPSGDAKYTVFTSANRLTDQHEFEAGVLATIGDAEVARVLCEDPVTHNIDGVDLKQEN